MTRNASPVVWLTFLLATASLGPMARAADGPARLLKDINHQAFSPLGSYPDQFARLGDVVLFRADTEAFGSELWKTDGTTAGTKLVKDLIPGPYGGFGYYDLPDFVPDFVEVNGVLLFPATDGVHNYEVWRTDGTTAGTFMLADIRPGDNSGLETYLTGTNRLVRVWVHAVSAGLAYFLADDGVHGFELWRTDGTREGTFQLADITPGRSSAFGSYGDYRLDAATLGSIFYFRAGPSGALYRTDGTSGGTRIADEIGVGPGSWPQHLTRAGDFIFFQVSEHVYRTDGTASGTILLHTFDGLTMEFHGEIDGKVLFRAYDAAHGLEPWISDGTPAGTRLLKDVNPYSVSYALRDLARTGSVAWFQADDGVHGPEVWRSDGTPDGTRLATDLTPGPAGTPITAAVSFGGGILLRVPDGLFRIDPEGETITRIATPLSTRPVHGSGLAALGNLALFAGDDGAHGNELWRSDGTQPGTGMLADIDPLPRNSPSYGLPGLGVALDSSGQARLLFAAYDGQSDWNLWATDGTPCGTTRLVPDGTPRGATGLVQNLLPIPSAPRGAALRGVLYFAAGDEQGEWALWSSDGTSAGTRKVKSRFGEAGVLVSSPVASRDRLYFAVAEPGHLFELWSSDGSDAGSRLVADIHPGVPWSRIDTMVAAGDTLFFTAYLDRGTELWTTDGTAAGTRVVKTEYGWRASCCGVLGPLAGRLLFQASDGLWISDGTEAGTVGLTGAIWPSSFAASEMAAAGPLAYLLSGAALWKTDGTAAGTLMVKDFRPGEGFSMHLLGPVGDSVVLAIRSFTESSEELWRSDGTEAGTVRVRDFPRHPWAGSPTSAAFDGGILLSEIGDLDHGMELWRTDGTDEGTALVQDLAPGPAWSSPQAFVRFGSRILFMADDPIANVEPFAGRAAILLGQPQRAILDLRDELHALGLPQGIETSLVAKLNTAATALRDGRKTEAVMAIENFIRHAQARLPGRVEAADAGDLIEFAQDLLVLLGAGTSG